MPFERGKVGNIPEALPQCSAFDGGPGSGPQKGGGSRSNYDPFAPENLKAGEEHERLHMSKFPKHTGGGSQENAAGT